MSMGAFSQGEASIFTAVATVRNSALALLFGEAGPE
jgi:hypothetical protein